MARAARIIGNTSPSHGTHLVRGQAGVAMRPRVGWGWNLGRARVSIRAYG